MSCAPFLAAWVGVVALAAAPRVDSKEVKRRQAPTKVEIQRKQAELKRRSADVQRKAADRTHHLPPAHLPPPPPGFDEHRRKVAKSLADSANAKKTAEQATASFNAASAPSPEDCWRAFVSTARSATTFDPLLKYLPLERRIRSARDRHRSIPARGPKAKRRGASAIPG